MGYPRCHPYICPRFAYPIIGSFSLENGLARITPDPPTPTPLLLQVDARVTQAFESLINENGSHASAVVPNYGMAIVEGREGGLEKAIVIAFLPFTAPDDNTKRMTPSQALDLYRALFENRNNSDPNIYETLIKQYCNR